MKKLLLVAVIVFLLIAAAVTFFRLEIIKGITVYALQQSGLTDIEISPADLRADALTIDHFSCVLPESGGHLSASRIRINWDWTIFSRRQLTGISIDALTLDIQSTTNQTNPIPRQQRIASFARQLQSGQPSFWKPFLPFKKLHLEKLLINGTGAGPVAGRKISLDIDNKTDGIVARILLPQEQLQLDLATVDTPGLTLKLHKVGQAAFATASIVLHDRNMAATTRIDLAGLPIINPLLATPLPKLAGMLSGRTTFSLQKQLTLDSAFQLLNLNLAQLSADALQIVLHGSLSPAKESFFSNKLTVDISNIRQPLFQAARIKLDLKGFLRLSQDELRYTFTSRKTNEIQQLTIAGLHIDAINLPASMGGIVTNNKLQVHLPAKGTFIFSELRTGPSSLSKLAVMPLQNTTFSAAFTNGFPWFINPGSWQVTAATTQLANMSLELQPLRIRLEQLTGNRNNRHLRTKITCPAIHLHIEKNGSTLTNISTEIQGDSANIHGQASWSLNTIPGVFSLKFRHNLKTGRGGAVIATRKPLTLSKATPLSAAIDTWPLPADLTEGELQGKSTIRWQPLKITARMSLNNGVGHVKNVNFSGLSLDQDMLLCPFIRSIKPGALAIDTIDVGLPIHNFSTKIRMKPSGKPLPEIILDNTRASILGGTVSNDYMQIDPQKPDLQTTIRLNNIQLADLLTLQQVKGLRVTGSVHGELPIHLDKAGLHVDTGRLANEKPGGIIKYNPSGENGLKNSPLTGYALKALEEFHYNLLSASADYNPDGTLMVKLHLEGKSPKLDTRRPVHLNITTEQNLLSLLKSLRYSASLTNEIDREVQHHFHSKPSP